MSKYLKQTDGKFRVRSHPGWRIDDNGSASRLLNDEELAEHGFYLIVDERPSYDSDTQELTEAPPDEWPIEDGKAIKQYVVVDLSAETIHRRFSDKVDRERDRRLVTLLDEVTGRQHSPQEAEKAIIDGAREATRLLNKKVRHADSWSDEDESRAEELEQLDSQVETIEEAARKLKRMEPIPTDYADDRWWE